MLPWMVLVKFLFTFQLSFLYPKLINLNILHQHCHSLLESVKPFHSSCMSESFKKLLVTVFLICRG